MSIVYSVVACNEEHGSLQENFSVKESPNATVVLRCAYVNRYALANDILMNRRPWPQYSNVNVPRAVSAGIVPVPTTFVQDGQSMDYQDALVTVNYSSEVNDLYTEEIEPTAEFQILDYKRFRWGSGSGDALLEGEAPGRLTRGLNLVRGLLQVPDPLPTALYSYVGSCNSNYVVTATLGFTFAPETLLYVPPHLSRTIRSDGTDGWNLTLKFMYKPEGWNQFWRSKTGDYERIYIAGGVSPYQNHPTNDFGIFWL